MQEDVKLCRDIMAMRDYAELHDAEDSNPKALKPDHLKFMVQMERMAEADTSRLPLAERVKALMGVG